MTTRIKLRRDTATSWATVNPVLALAEPGLETDTNKVKYGDGTTAWTSLPYASTLPVGMVPSEWYGAPNLTNDLAANSDANYMQFQTQTDWVGNNDYGRSTLSWHDANVSMYSHVQADPYGVSIRNAEWFDGYQARYWEFQADGRTRFPNGLVFDTWNDSNITNDYIKLYESDDSGESNGEYNAYLVQLQSITKYENENDYGRATLSWHDYDYSNYSHVHVDPEGASIRLADWSGNRGNYRSYWQFNNDGSTEFPGAIVNATETKTTSTGNTIEIDLTKTVNKLTATGGGTTANGVYHLADGTEGQIMYLVPAGGTVTNEYTGINIDNYRYRNLGDNSIYEGTSGNYWLPFLGQNATVITLIFTDGHWNIPHNSFD